MYLMIVEDDADTASQYQMNAKIALAELRGEGLMLESQVDIATSYAQAMTLIESYPQKAVDFISVDLALDVKETKLTNKDRKIGIEPGGIQILKELQEQNKDNKFGFSLAVIASGETLQSYAIDAFQKYGVLKFFQKGETDPQEYRDVIKACLWYSYSLDVIENAFATIFDDINIPFIENVLLSTHVALERAEISEKNLPVNLAQLLEEEKYKYIDQFSELPVGRWTDGELKRRVIRPEEAWEDEKQKSDNWTIICFTIKNFAHLVQRWPSQEEPIITYLGKILRKIEQEYMIHNKDVFVGRLGYPQTFVEPRFVLIFGEISLQAAHHILDSAKNEFDSSGTNFIPDFEIASAEMRQQFQLSIEAQLWSSENNDYFPDLNNLKDRLGADQVDN